MVVNNANDFQGDAAGRREESKTEWRNDLRIKNGAQRRLYVILVFSSKRAHVRGDDVAPEITTEKSKVDIQPSCGESSVC